MTNSSKQGLSDHPIIVFIGLVAIVITIAIFITGKNSLPEMIDDVQESSGEVVAQATDVVLPQLPFQKIIQVGPYWGYRSDLGESSLMLNILSTGTTCIDEVEIIIDGQQWIAMVIDDPNDLNYIEDSLPFENSTGMSCNYLIGNEAIRISQKFSVPITTYGINLPARPPDYDKWCYQAIDKTWIPCK